MSLRDHFGHDVDHDLYADDRVYKLIQWFGPLGIGLEDRTVCLRVWLPKFEWMWGYWR